MQLSHYIMKELANAAMPAGEDDFEPEWAFGGGNRGKGMGHRHRIRGSVTGYIMQVNFVSG